jgi:hypothetical protein
LNIRHLLTILVVATLLACTLAAAQEGRTELSTEEIISRHEATWEKLNRYFVQVDVQGQKSISDVYVENARKIRVVKLDHRSFLYRESDRHLSLHSGANREEIVGKYVHDKGLFSYARKDLATIENRAESSHPVSHFLVGSEISKQSTAPSITLRTWIDRDRPTLERGKNEAGQTIYRFKGKCKSIFNTRHKKGVEIDELLATVNVDRGCLIESLAFASPKQASQMAEKSSVWRVVDWIDIGEGLYFPKQVHTESTFWNIEDRNFCDYVFSRFTTKPTDLERQIENVFYEDSKVFDYTGRPGVPKVSIWGADGKAKKTYDDVKTFMKEDASRQIELKKAELSKECAKAFAGRKVEIIWSEKDSNFHTTVSAESGEITHNFKSVAELESFIKTKLK